MIVNINASNTKQHTSKKTTTTKIPNKTEKRNNMEGNNTKIMLHETKQGSSIVHHVCVRVRLNYLPTLACFH